MRVSTDAVLLGAWAEIPDGCRSVVDVGCGTGVLALMAAQRTEGTGALITGVEIDEAAGGEACENFARSPWADRLTLMHGDAMQVCPGLPQTDALICNPPYFSPSRHQLESPDARRAMARHGDGLGYESLLALASAMLSERGVLSMISPSDRRDDIEWSLSMNRLHVRRLTEVSSAGRRSPSRLLWSIGRELTCPVTDRLVLNGPDGQRSDEFRILTNDFYLD